MDLLLIFVQLTLGMLGVLGIATSQADTGLWIRQLLAVLIGLVTAFGISKLNPNAIVKLSPFSYVVTLLLLIAVLFFGSSPSGSEAKRWLLISGFSVQPSELMKVAIIAYLTAFFHNHIGRWELWRPMLLVSLAVGLVILEPNVSTGLFIFLLALSMMLIAGTTLTRLASIAFASLAIASVIAGPYLSKFGYIWERLATFVSREKSTEFLEGAGYQSTRAAAELVEAGWFGTGPGHFLGVPEAHNDMIAISIAQAMGLTGIITLVILYMFIAGRGIRIARYTRGPGSLLAAGATAYICGQAALNLLVASGTLPVTGVVLPFVSHGLNSLVSVSIAMGFLHSAHRQAKRQGAAL